MQTDYSLRKSIENTTIMKKRIKAVVLMYVFFLAAITSAQDSISPENLTVLLGKWTGTLTYLNYSDGTPFTMPAELDVKKGKNKYQLILFTSYPKEPNANSKGMIKLSKDGTLLNKEPIISIEQLENEEVHVITEYKGKDNHKKALIKNIYTLGKNRLVIRKKVKFEDKDTWLTRNEYQYTR